ncbi:unnamed protein product, partial [Adineta steineri]
SLTAGLVVESIALAVITPQVRKIFKFNNQRITPATGGAFAVQVLRVNGVMGY